ncbi:GntR family transcriptional regulator [Streptomyces tendae]
MPRNLLAVSGEAARQYAHDELRRSILLGDLVPGQRVLETEFSERLGVTRAALRAALLDLSVEGLIERVPRRGARVRGITVEEAVAITECRMVLEGLCAARTAVHATDRQIDELDELLARMTTAVAQSAVVAYSDLNRRLHARVNELSGQRMACELLDRLNAQLVRHHFHLALRPGHPAQSLREHRALVDAIRARDPQAAETAARSHAAGVIQALRSTLAPAAPTAFASPFVRRHDHDPAPR